MSEDRTIGCPHCGKPITLEFSESELSTIMLALRYTILNQGSPKFRMDFIEDAYRMFTDDRIRGCTAG